MSEVKTIWHPDKEGGVTIQRTQDVSGILESNRAMHNDSEQNSKSAFRRVANIPNSVIEQWMKEGINFFDMGKDPDVRKAVLRKLNSPEWKYLRTHNSRL